MGIRAKRRSRKLFRLCAPLVLCLNAGCSSHNAPSPETRLDLVPFLDGSQMNPFLTVRLTFLDEDKLLATVGGQDAKGVVIGLNDRKVMRTIPLGDCYVMRVWRTADSHLVVFCRDHLMTYDAAFQKQAERKLDNWAPTVEVSPDGKLFTLDSGRYAQDHARKSKFQPSYFLYDADSLKQLQGNLPEGFTPITDNGSIVVKDDRVYFLPFAGGEPTQIFTARPHSYVFPEVLAENRIVLEMTPIRSSVVVDYSGAIVYPIARWPGNLAVEQSSASSTRFLMAFEGRTTLYALSQVPADLLGADERPNIAIFDVLDSLSGKQLFDVSWRIQSDPVFGRALETVAALSNDGRRLAAIRGRSLEVYRVPGN